MNRRQPTRNIQFRPIFGQVVLSLLLCGIFNSIVWGQEPIRFDRKIRPILAENCFPCHGRDEKDRQADLRLDTAEGSRAEHYGTAAIVPGDLDASELWARITQDDDERMPPPKSQKSLTPAEIQLIKQWILQGAEYQQHWSFEPPTAISPPPVESSPPNPIDAFILERLRSEGLSMAPEADRRTLIRRVAFALTGLPPTIEEIDAFVADPSPQAYEAMVDRYLASPRFGEEMARHWLDLARYGDTHGLHLDNERQMWAYRDWVVNAFNRNLPFDQFTIDQLAGDLLDNPTLDQWIATGFNRCNVTSSEGGSIDDELIYRYAVDRTSTMAQTWMGLTAGCATCHDHKFDPISQKEFYSLYAFFNSAADPAMDGNALLTQPAMKLMTPEDKKQLAALDDRIAGLQKALDAAAVAFMYEDPASQQPPPPKSTVEVDWMEDDFPPTGQARGGPGHATQFVTATEGNHVFSGLRALRRSDPGLSQDVWDQASVPLTIPDSGTIFVHVWIDPVDIPKSMMLQFYKNGWLHRAVWGDYDAIQWGAVNTTERVSMGSLPETGRWVQLEVPAEKIGLSAGDQITGFATTQYGGTVFWDKLGVRGVSDPAADPRRSFLAWWRQATGKDTAGLSPELNAIAKQGPDVVTDPSMIDRLRAYYVQSVCVDSMPHFAQQKEEVSKLQAERKSLDDAIPSTFVYKDRDQPRDSFVMIRGQYNQPGEPVTPGVPAFLPPLKRAQPDHPATRLDLARWLVSDDHPLTARVAVNRYWQQLFGTGLVSTSGDFGIQGRPPSHPELLDWLAIQFRQSHWDVKAMIRLMITSRAFRQDSRVREPLAQTDPGNILLARGPRFRLDAEQIRDNALFVSGLIDLEMGGKGVKPYQPDNIWEPVGFAGSNTRFYKRDDGSALYRRSLYTFYKRTAPPPFMVNFDAPSREQTCTRRERSDTPLQALQLMNDVQHIEAARALAQRVLLNSRDDQPSAVARMFQLVLARQPSPAEADTLNRQLEIHLRRYRDDAASAAALIAEGESKPDASLDPVTLAAHTMVANTILNLDETLTRN